MCGICGIVDYNNSSVVEQGLIERMCGFLRHRGPDDEGVVLLRGRAHVGLGHRRLSIIDLSRQGHQPMTNEDQSVWIVFNGEIYNFQELKKDLIAKGHKFLSAGDTEVILHLYEEFGESCLDKLRGMFAFAIWDKNKDSLFLARDRAGKKPLFYSLRNGVFSFASELSALSETGLIKKEVNPEAVDFYLSFGYIPAPLTIYKDVFKIPPAHKAVIRDARISCERYWDLSYRKIPVISERVAQEETLRLLREAVKERLYSDVPLGAFLSGGIDSSTIVALMSEVSGDKINTFSIGFTDADYDELSYARQVAKRFNTNHREFIVRPAALDVLGLLVEHYAEPYADSSAIPTYYVAQQTRNYVTVALSGDGGDESFAGYERYQAMIAAGLYKKLPFPLKWALQKTAALIPDTADQKSSIRRLKRLFDGMGLPDDSCYLRWVGIFDEKLKNLVYSDRFKRDFPDNQRSLQWLNLFFKKNTGDSLLDRLLYTDVNTYLPGDVLTKVDIASMANSLEVRAPFLDHRLMEFVASLPAKYKMRNFTKKYLLKRAVSGILPKNNIQRRKMGFGIPVGRWFRQDLKDFLRDTLFNKNAIGRGYFNPEAVKGMFDLHITRKADYTQQLWALLMLELWHRRFMDKNR